MDGGAGTVEADAIDGRQVHLAAAPGRNVLGLRVFRELAGGLLRALARGLVGELFVFGAFGCGRFGCSELRGFHGLLSAVGGGPSGAGSAVAIGVGPNSGTFAVTGAPGWLAGSLGASRRRGRGRDRRLRARSWRRRFFRLRACRSEERTPAPCRARRRPPRRRWRAASSCSSSAPRSRFRLPPSRRRASRSAGAGACPRATSVPRVAARSCGASSRPAFRRGARRSSPTRCRRACPRSRARSSRISRRRCSPRVPSRRRAPRRFRGAARRGSPSEWRRRGVVVARRGSVAGRRRFVARRGVGALAERPPRRRRSRSGSLRRSRARRHGARVDEERCGLLPGRPRDPERSAPACPRRPRSGARPRAAAPGVCGSTTTSTPSMRASRRPPASRSSISSLRPTFRNSRFEPT